MIVRTGNQGNAEPYLSRYLHTKGAALGLPVNGTFELTARCNFDCKMCYVHQKKDAQELMRRELITEEWIRIGKDARDAGMVFLLLTGGEPFLREDFPELYTALIKMGFMVSINTNASLYSDKLDALFRAYPPTRINVTLYGGSEETYQNLCGNASYEKVIANLKRMKEAGLSVRLNASMTPWNIGDLKRLDEISRELSLQMKLSAYMYPPIRVDGEETIGANKARLSAVEAGETFGRWHELRDGKERFSVRAEKIREGECTGETPECVDEGEAPGEKMHCRAGCSSFWLTWEGKMVPCGTMGIEGTDVRAEGFGKAWEDCKATVQEIRLPAECASCKLKQNCGVCASICLSETGAYERKPEYMCEMTGAMCRYITEHAN